MISYKFVQYGLVIFLMSFLLHSAVLGQSSSNKGYINRTGVDMLAGKDGRNIRLQMTHGYHITDRFIAGIGAGYVFYHNPVDVVPIFVDLTYLLSKGKMNPFLQLRFGSGVTILRDQTMEPESHKAGAFLNAALGLQFTDGKGAGIYLSAGLNMDQVILESEAFMGRTVRDLISYRRLSLSIGFVFF